MRFWDAIFKDAGNHFNKVVLYFYEVFFNNDGYVILPIFFLCSCMTKFVQIYLLYGDFA